MKTQMILSRFHQKLSRHCVGFLILVGATILISSCIAKTDFTIREQDFDLDWKFNLGDVYRS